MSVRAYKITKIEYSDNESFNLWHDTEVNDWLESGGYYEGFDGNGLLGLNVASVKDLIKHLKEVDKKQKEQLYSTYIIPQLQKDIAGLPNDEYVTYMCF